MIVPVSPFLVFNTTSIGISQDVLFSSYKYLSGSGSCFSVGTLKGSRASIVIIPGDIVVAKFLELKGPRGTYSHVWISLADQSLSITKPKI